MKQKHLSLFLFAALAVASCKKLDPKAKSPEDIDTTDIDTIAVTPVCSGMPVLKWEKIIDSHMKVQLITADTAGNVYVGSKGDSLLYSLRTASITPISDPKFNLFNLTKFNTNGELVWTKSTFPTNDLKDTSLFIWDKAKLFVDDSQKPRFSIVKQGDPKVSFSLPRSYNLAYQADGSLPTFEDVSPARPVLEADPSGIIYYPSEGLNASLIKGYSYTSEIYKKKVYYSVNDLNGARYDAVISGARSGNLYTLTFAADPLSLDMDPGAGVEHITLPTTPQEVYAMLLKLDAAGNFVSVKYVPLTYVIGAIYKLSLDNSENVYISAIKDGAGTLTKISASGATLWTKSLTHSSIGFDNANNVYVSSNGNQLKKLDVAGNEIWSVTLDADKIAFKNNRHIYAIKGNTLKMYTICGD